MSVARMCSVNGCRHPAIEAQQQYFYTTEQHIHSQHQTRRAPVEYSNSVNLQTKRTTAQTTIKHADISTKTSKQHYHPRYIAQSYEKLTSFSVHIC